MTNNVLMETLNPTHSLTHSLTVSTLQQAWSFRDLSVGLEMTRDPVFEVLVIVLKDRVRVLVF